MEAPKEALGYIYKTTPTFLVYSTLAYLENECSSSDSSLLCAKFFHVVGCAVTCQTELLKRLASKEYNSIAKEDSDIDMVDYMQETIQQQTEAEVIEQIVYESLANGFLGRYIGMLKEILKSNNILLKRVAVVTLGKYMIASQKIAQELFPIMMDTLETLQENDDVLEINKMVIIADMQSVISSQSEEYLEKLFINLSHDNSNVRMAALVLVGSMMLRRLIKYENQLHMVVEALVLDEDLSSLAHHILLKIFSSEAKKVPAILMNILTYTLRNTSQTSLDFDESASAAAIVKLIHSIFSSESLFNKTIRKECTHLFLRSFMDQPKLATIYCLSHMSEELDNEHINELAKYFSTTSMSYIYDLPDCEKIVSYTVQFLKNMKCKTSNKAMKATIGQAIARIELKKNQKLLNNNITSLRTNNNKKLKLTNNPQPLSLDAISKFKQLNF